MIERSTMFVYLGAYLFYSLWKNDRFDSLRPSKILSGELKSVLTILLMLMTCVQMTAGMDANESYERMLMRLTSFVGTLLVDVTGSYIKYSEGFIATPDGAIVGKPFPYWTSTHRELSTVRRMVTEREGLA